MAHGSSGAFWFEDSTDVPPPVATEAEPRSPTNWQLAFPTAHERYGVKVPKTPSFGVGPRKEGTLKTTHTELTTGVPTSFHYGSTVFKNSVVPKFDGATRDDWYRALHPKTGHNAEPGSYNLGSSLMKQGLSNKRNPGDIKLKTTEDRIMMHRQSHKAAGRSPGPVYMLPDQFAKPKKATPKTRQKGFGFGHGTRFRDPHKEKRDKEGPGPASRVLKSTLGSNSKKFSMQSRKSLNKLNAYQAKTDSPGPGTKNINLPSTLGRDSRSYSMLTRDAFLDKQEKKKSETSTMRAMVQERQDTMQRINTMRRVSGLGGTFAGRDMPFSPIQAKTARQSSLKARDMVGVHGFDADADV